MDVNAAGGFSTLATDDFYLQMSNIEAGLESSLFMMDTIARRLLQLLGAPPCLLIREIDLILEISLELLLSQAR
jgi:hypothetical protein